MRYQFMRFPKGRWKAVTCSYDDGVRQDIRLAGILGQHGIKGTFNINSGFVAQTPKNRHLTAEEIKEYLLNRGHEIAVHGQNHRAPGVCRPIELIQDVLNCRLELEKEFGRTVRGMAYPDGGIKMFQYGMDYESVKSCLKELDIVYARTWGGDNSLFRLPTDWHAWVPTVHHGNPLAAEYAEASAEMKLSGNHSQNHPRLFYFWGHSYEFDHNQNWDLLENLCKVLGERDEIWYVTNMELYDYVCAYESLIYSADGKQIYNPTLIKIWFDRDGQLYSIDPGQTKQIGG